MARPKGTSRVGGGQPSPSRRAVAEEPTLPGLRQRRPVMFWVVVVAALAMVVITVAPIISALQ